MIVNKMKSSTRTFLALIISLPTANPAARMRVWRGLKALGCGALRDGVYLLPEVPGKEAALLPWTEEVAGSGGTAHLVRLESRDGKQALAFRALFDRGAEYADLHRKIAKFRAGLARAEAGRIRKEVKALRREFDSLAELDFFPGEARKQVRAALEEAEAAATAAVSPGEPHSAPRRIKHLDRRRYRGRLWATRKRPWVDRVASAWLIRRFIDPDARFRWLDDPRDCPKKALGFDFDGAAFTHADGRVTFEVLAASFGLDRDPALARIGGLVHFLDVGGVPVPESAGLESVLEGLRQAHSDDDALLGAASGIFDALYLAYGGQ